jgi:hypothetical protein
MAEKRALKILFETYWSSKGWKSAGNHNWVPQTPPNELAYAIDAGVMFPARTLSHDESIRRIENLRRDITPRDVGAAFIANLFSGSIALRSALASYGVALHMPVHSFITSGLGIRCQICGSYDTNGERDLNVLSFERHKWGGVRHADPTYIAFDLERFSAESGQPPSAENRRDFCALLQLIGAMPAGARLADLVAAIKPLVPGGTAQRRCVIATMGFAGVLRIPGRPGFFREFTPVNEREETPWYKDDWEYPIRWWRGGHGIDHEAVSFWFGRFT